MLQKLIIGGICIVCATVGLLLVHRVPGPIPNTFKPLNLNSADINLSNRTVIDHTILASGVVSYSYVGEKVPEQISSNEVPELRTANSYTQYLGIAEDGENPILKLNSRFFPQDTFVKSDDGAWHVIEHATTTEQAFNSQTNTYWKTLTELFVHTAYALSVAPYSEAGDGYVEGFGLDENPGCASVWGTEVEGTNDSTSVSGSIQAQSRVAAQTCTSTIHRFFVPFITSAIPSGATISAATLNVYVVSKTNNSNDGTDYATVVRTSQATHTALTSDYNAVGSTEGIDSGERKDITSISTSAYLVFTLNSTGLGWIAKSGQASNCSATTGITCLGIREGHDMTGIEPSSALAGNIVTFSTSEETGSSQDPHLDVTYTAPADTMRIKISNGRINVSGGRLKIQSN